MQKTLFLSILVLFSSPSWAHKAHSHSAGRASLAFDGSKGAFELELPAIVVVDFEHRPKNPVQKVKLQKALDSLKDSIGKVLIIEPSAACEISDTSSEVVYSGKKETHSEFKMTAQIQCQKNLKLSEIRIPVLNLYPKLEKIEVQTLMGDSQKSFILKGKQDTLN